MIHDFLGWRKISRQFRYYVRTYVRTEEAWPCQCPVSAVMWHTVQTLIIIAYKVCVFDKLERTSTKRQPSIVIPALGASGCISNADESIRSVSWYVHLTDLCRTPCIYLLALSWRFNGLWNAATINVYCWCTLLQAGVSFNNTAFLMFVQNSLTKWRVKSKSQILFWRNTCQ